MKCDWRHAVGLECFTRAELVPPAMFGEAAWDCLLALYADARRELSLDQLAGVISIPTPSLQHCLVGLESRQLVTGELDGSGEIRAVLTPGGRELLETYLTATSNLQFWQQETPRLANGRSGPAAN